MLVDGSYRPSRVTSRTSGRGGEMESRNGRLRPGVPEEAAGPMPDTTGTCRRGTAGLGSGVGITTPDVVAMEPDTTGGRDEGFDFCSLARETSAPEYAVSCGVAT